MRDKMIRWMQGRYGVDNLSKFLMLLGVLILLVSVFVNNIVVILIGWAVIIFSYSRTFSKNHARCYHQNMRYLKYQNRVKAFLNREKNHMEQRKTHKIYACPSCKQKVRIPKGRGKVEVSCPKCSEKFVRRR